MPHTHKKWMDHAKKLSLKGGQKVFPNPMVGAVLIKNNQIIGQGYHRVFGGPHAEIEALNNAKKNNHSPFNSTLYVTLEPCCHHGKTPPCTEAILKAGITKVVYAQKDPNPKVCGQGIAFLQQNNIKTILFPERPFIHLKIACTLDKKITLKKGEATPLTNSKSNKKVHSLRAKHDAILVGIQTILTDNPRLTVRHVTGKNPIRIILDSQLRTPIKASLLAEPGETIIATTKLKTTKKYPKNTTILSCKSNKNNQVDLQDLLKKLLARNINSILVEGGELISTSFLKNNLVDQLTLIYTPHLAQNPSLPAVPDLLSLKPRKTKLIQDNLWVEKKPLFT